MMAKMNDSWFLHPLTLDAADQRPPELLFATPEDARGRGIDLTIRNGGEVVDTTGCTVLLAWHNLNTGEKSTRKFDAVDAAKGRWKCTYPTSMQSPGLVRARIVVMLESGETITSSREFDIKVEHVIANDLSEQAKDDLSAFQQAALELNKLNDDVKKAEEARAAAETARASAERDRVSAETARKSAETARASAGDIPRHGRDRPHERRDRARRSGKARHRRGRPRRSGEEARHRRGRPRRSGGKKRVSEFARLKGESEKATGAANAAAERANTAATTQRPQLGRLRALSTRP
ncbi:MAG: BppU family phage baseplate upper protein [Coriobacteriaceae bacterium]